MGTGMSNSSAGVISAHTSVLPSSLASIGVVGKHLYHRAPDAVPNCIFVYDTETLGFVGHILNHGRGDIPSADNTGTSFGPIDDNTTQQLLSDGTHIFFVTVTNTRYGLVVHGQMHCRRIRP